MTLLRLALSFALFLSPALARSGEGRIELNHLRALAGGVTPGDSAGYPISITQPGSYVLTGDLTAPPALSAIIITASDVSVDLNGFAVHGSFQCAAGSCTSTAGTGIVSAVAASNVRVANGNVYGFGALCVDVSTASRVERLYVRDCGLDGIRAGAGSRVIANRVDAVGRDGIALASRDSFYGDNVVGAFGIALASRRSIAGGSALSGNVCNGGGCSRRGAQRYYVTASASSTGSTALSACAVGFHMASIYELLDTARLEYERTLGATTGDSGTGPPASVAGRVRPGNHPSGAGNCDDWTSSLATDEGTQATLLPVISLGVAATQIAPWQIGASGTCDLPARVWCVED